MALFLGGYLRGVWLTSHNYSSIPLATSKNIGARRSFSNFGGKCEAKKKHRFTVNGCGGTINGKMGKRFIEKWGTN